MKTFYFRRHDILFAAVCPYFANIASLGIAEN